MVGICPHINHIEIIEGDYQEGREMVITAVEEKEKEEDSAFASQKTIIPERYIGVINKETCKPAEKIKQIFCLCFNTLENLKQFPRCSILTEEHMFDIIYLSLP